MASTGDGCRQRGQVDERVQVRPDVVWGGADMKIKYKGTTRGGLAVNVSEC